MFIGENGPLILSFQKLPANQNLRQRHLQTGASNHIQPFISILSHFWLFLATCDSFQPLLMTISYHSRLFLTSTKHFQPIPTTPSHFWPYSAIFCYFWPFLATCDPFQPLLTNAQKKIHCLPLGKSCMLGVLKHIYLSCNLTWL